MKIFKLSVYSGANIDYAEVKAEAHTFDGGMILFWTRNSADEWAMVAAYPASRTAITYYDEIGTPKISGQAIAKVMEDMAPLLEVSDNPKPKKTRSKK